MALIVVHAHHDIVPAAQCLAEHAVRGQGTDGVDPFGPGCFDRRSDLGDLLGAEQSVLSAMGIQAGNRHPRLFNADILAGLVRNLDHIQHTVFFETVCLLSKLNAKQHIEVDIHMDELDLTDAEKKATYSEIKEYVLEHTGLKVSSLYIAQVKQKCGIIERENYNKPKSDDAKQPQCPPDKEKAIKEALKHFGMI